MGYNRYQVFNDWTNQLNFSAATNFGKFADIDRPLQVWEPSDELEILQDAKMFKKSNHKSGYAYAINIDPAMYMTYVGPVSKEAWNKHLKHIGLNLKYP